MSTEGMDPTARLLTSLQALAVASAQGSDTKRLQEEAAAAITEWSDRVTPQDRALLREGLRVINEWSRQPGEETGKRMDAMIERMQRGLRLLITPDSEAKKAADEERLRASVRESIARRLREARAENSQNE